MDLHNAIKIAQRGFVDWSGKSHNKKWFRRIEGTPIPNDLPIVIAEQFAAEVPGYLDIENAVGGAYEMLDGRKFWIDRAVATEIARRVCAISSVQHPCSDHASP